LSLHAALPISHSSARIVVGHLAAAHGVLRRTEHVVDEHTELETTHQRGAELAVAGEDEIVLPHGEGGAQDRRFLAERADVKSDASLSLERDESLVEQDRKSVVQGTSGEC